MFILNNKVWIIIATLFSGIFLSLVSGCSTTPQRFDDKDVHFKLVNHQSMKGAEAYTIQISSTSPTELTHLSLYLGYPIKIPNGSKENPFSIKGRTNEAIVNLEKGQSAQFTFYAPIREVFGDSKLLDFNSPEIDLEGYTKEGNTEIPFEIGGALEVFVGKF
jgi:hypothetical protein